MAVVAIVLSGATPALGGMADAARRGCEGAGGTGELLDAAPASVERALEADALLVCAPMLLGGWPGAVKGFFDAWLPLVRRGDLIPRTSRMRAGYATLYAPDDPEGLEILHRQSRHLFAHFGMTYCGRAAGHSPEGAALPDPGLLLAAERLGAALAGAEGRAGWPDGYLEGVRLFNEGQYYEAHEAWEEVWVEEGGPLRLFFQGLIQAAAAFHHHGNVNFAGMASLLREAREKLLRYRPRTMGIDVDAFLESLEPWRLLAEARVGRGGPVTRMPTLLPTIAILE